MSRKRNPIDKAIEDYDALGAVERRVFIETVRRVYPGDFQAKQAKPRKAAGSSGASTAATAARPGGAK